VPVSNLFRRIKLLSCKYQSLIKPLRSYIAAMSFACALQKIFEEGMNR